MKTVFFGTPIFAAEILGFLYDHGVEIVAVVTQPDRAKGRGQQVTPTPVKSLSFAKRPDVPIFQPEKASTEDFAKKLKQLNPDLFVVAAYGEIIKSNLLQIPTITCLNVHPSILPKYRGATPIQGALLNGDQETGVTIIEMVLKMDAGDIYKIVKVPIPEEMTFGELEKILCKLAGPALLEVISQLQQGTAKKLPQDAHKATYVSKITAEDRLIDWRKSSREIYNQIRAFSPQPGAYCVVEVGGQEKKLLIRKSRVYPQPQGDAGQSLTYEKNQWIVACGNGAISLLELQLEGKKNLSIDNFIRGMPVAPKIKIQ